MWRCGANKEGSGADKEGCGANKNLARLPRKSEIKKQKGGGRPYGRPPLSAVRRREKNGRYASEGAFFRDIMELRRADRRDFFSEEKERMVYFLDAAGTLLRCVPERVYRGSAEANKIVLVAPFRRAVPFRRRSPCPTARRRARICSHTKGGSARRKTARKTAMRKARGRAQGKAARTRGRMYGAWLFPPA